MNRPSESIVLPFYNAAPFLGATVDSVLGQSRADWELILVDDGSDDGSSELARDLAGTYPDRITYVEHAAHANLGQFATRVVGAQVARSELIALLDADDIWSPDYLEEHLRAADALRDGAAALSYGPALFWCPYDPTQKSDYVQALPPGAPMVYPPGTLLRHFLRDNYAVTPCPSATLIRRSVLKEVAHWSRQAQQLLAYEDQILWWYVGAHYSISVHTSCRVKYRVQNPASSVAVTNADPERARRAHIQFLMLLIEHLRTEVPDHELFSTGELEATIKALLDAGPLRW